VLVLLAVALPAVLEAVAVLEVLVLLAVALPAVLEAVAVLEVLVLLTVALPAPLVVQAETWRRYKRRPITLSHYIRAWSPPMAGPEGMGRRRSWTRIKSRFPACTRQGHSDRSLAASTVSLEAMSGSVAPSAASPGGTRRLKSPGSNNKIVRRILNYGQDKFKYNSKKIYCSRFSGNRSAYCHGYGGQGWGGQGSRKIGVHVSRKEGFFYQ
jgi:hypothetical protein